MEQNTTIITLDEEQLWNLNSHHHISTVNAQCTRSVQQCDHYLVVHHEQSKGSNSTTELYESTW